MIRANTLTKFCELCSKPLDQPREVMVSGTLFNFCCSHCEDAFLLSKRNYRSKLPSAVVEPFHPVFSWLRQAAEDKASDLFLSTGEPPTVKIYGIFHKLSFEPVDEKTLETFVKTVVPQEKLESFYEGHDVDFGLDMNGVSRFRVNVFRHLKGMSLAVRPLSSEIPTLKDLGLPDAFSALTRLRQGLILVTGPAGSGKSTTLASFINTINQTQERHILTIEDPIEYIIENNRSLIHQREVGCHTRSFADGLRSALRENPDIIVVGELRDLESISLALRAAETGHLVLGTLHSGSAVQTLTRIIDVFDSVRQQQVLCQLAQSLRCVCSQRLIKRKYEEGMVLATEVLMVTLAISNIIRQNRVHEIQGYMETGQRENMHTFKQSLSQLVATGLVEKE
jgi:twitching motility protein PilT